MAQLKEIMAYVLSNYPIKSELSNARVTKIIYLADWHQAINYNRQISPIDWYFDNYGPFVWDVYKEAKRQDNLFCLNDTMNMFGQLKTLLSLKNKNYTSALTKQEKESLDHIINVTRSLNWNGFIKLVYSTYPITSSERYSSLDLLQKAKEYNLQNA